MGFFNCNAIFYNKLWNEAIQQIMYLKNFVLYFLIVFRNNHFEIIKTFMQNKMNKSLRKLAIEHSFFIFILYYKIRFGCVFELYIFNFLIITSKKK